MSGERIDYSGVCSKCYQPVSRRAEKADQRVPNDNGGFDHARCHEDTAEMALLREIFGQTDATPRIQYASDRAGELAGHEVSYLPGAEWRCTCGMGGRAAAYDKSEAKRQGRAHMRASFAMRDAR